MAASVDIARRAFLRGRPKPPPSVRPPWAIAEAPFVESCTRCDACRDACPERIIHAGDGGYPELDFATGGCTFCGACADVCPEPIFHHVRDAVPWRHVVSVGDDCLARGGIYCMSCKDACQFTAIDFTRERMPTPSLNTTRCTGCGECIATCPADAIAVDHDVAT